MFLCGTLICLQHPAPAIHHSGAIASGHEGDPMFKCGFQLIIQLNLARCNFSRCNFMRKFSSRKSNPIMSLRRVLKLDMQIRKSDVERRSPAPSMNQAQHFVPRLAQFPQAGGRPPRGEKKVFRRTC
jgi:hypothetical protein